MVTPSRNASSISCCAAGIFSIDERESKVTLAPSLDAESATSCAVWPKTTFSAKSFSAILEILPKRRATEATSIEVSPPPIQTTLSDETCRRPSLNASKKATPLIQFGASSKPSIGKPRPSLQPIAHKIAS